MSSDAAPPQTNLNDQITSAWQFLFQFPPHKWKLTVIESCLIIAHRLKNKTNMLVVWPTGREKFLVYQVTVLMNRGMITLFISLLLALASSSSDQMQQRNLWKKISNIPHMGSVHLDWMKPSTIKTIADTAGAIMILLFCIITSVLSRRCQE